MSNLEITTVSITDAIEARAATCDLTLAPPTTELEPVAGVQFEGDSNIVSGGSIRPNGSVMNIVAGYGAVAPHSLFNGVVDEMDDLEDINQYTYTVKLTSTPVSQAHRTKITMVENQIGSRAVYEPSTTNPSVMLTLPAGSFKTCHKILKRCCDAVGIPMGRIDLPDHNVWGSFEIIRQNIIEIAEMFCAPFNTFEFQRYFVRCDNCNGLQIILVDYSIGAGVSNPYVLDAIESKSRTFQRYNPDNRIGDADVLITGAEIYGSADSDSRNNISFGPAEDLPLDDPVNADAGNPEPRNEPYRRRVVADHTYNSGTSNQERAGDIEGQDSSSEVETYVIFDCEIVTYDEDNAVDSGVWQSYNRLTNAPEYDINELIGWLANGSIDALSIKATNTMETTQTNKISGRIKDTTKTVYTYEEMTFSQNGHDGSTVNRVVLVSDEAVHTIYNEQGAALDADMTRRSYAYSDLGIQESTTVKSYKRKTDGTWGLAHLMTEFQDSPSVTQAEIQYWSKPTSERNAPEDASARQRAWQDRYNQAVGNGYSPSEAQAFAGPFAFGPNPGPQTWRFLNSNRMQDEERTPIGRYQLLNGYRLSVSSPSNTQDLRKPQAQSSTDPYATRKKVAFQMGAQWMDYTGLMLLWKLAKREMALETLNPYWEVVKVNLGLLDNTAAAGESVIAAGSAGHVVSVNHLVDEDNAVTSVTMRRLVW